MRQVLSERGTWVPGMKSDCGAGARRHSSVETCCVRGALLQSQDFAQRKSQLQALTEKKGHICVFLPKVSDLARLRGLRDAHGRCAQFHCELAPIERCWSWCKTFTRERCGCSIVQLRAVVPEALAALGKDTDFMKKQFNKVRRYIHAYHAGVPGPAAVAQEKKASQEKRTAYERLKRQQERQEDPLWAQLLQDKTSHRGLSLRAEAAVELVSLPDAHEYDDVDEDGVDDEEAIVVQLEQLEGACGFDVVDDE